MASFSILSKITSTFQSYFLLGRPVASVLIYDVTQLLALSCDKPLHNKNPSWAQNLLSFAASRAKNSGKRKRSQGKLSFKKFRVEQLSSTNNCYFTGIALFVFHQCSDSVVVAMATVKTLGSGVVAWPCRLCWNFYYCCHHLVFKYSMYVDDGECTERLNQSDGGSSSFLLSVFECVSVNTLTYIFLLSILKSENELHSWSQ